MEINSIINKADVSQHISENNYALNFKKGDVIVAEIVAANGDTIALKTSDELLLTGKLMSELQLSVGEHIEFEVKGKTGNKYVLQTLPSAFDTVEISYDSSEQTGSSKASIIISNLLSNINIEADQGAIDEILAALDENPQLDMKTAVFMLTNDIALEEENIEIIRQFESNDNLFSEKLLAMLNKMVSDAAFPGKEYSSAFYKPINEGSSENTINTSDILKEGGGEGNNNQLVDSISEDKVGDFVFSQIETPQAAQQEDSEVVAELQNNQFISAEKTVDSQENAQIKTIINGLFSNKSNILQKLEQQQNQPVSHGNLNHSSNPENFFEDKAFQSLLPKIILLFTKIEEIKSGKTSIKNADKEQMQKLFELKETIKSSDIKNRDILTAKTEELISQNKVLSEIKRFSFFNIPINFGKHQETAEIYVYKRKKNKSKKNPQETRILIGLDTQNLGRFEVLVKANAKNLSIRMSRENEIANEVIELRSKKLKKLFNDMGYKLTSFKLEKLLEKTTLANAEQVLVAGIKSHSQVDYTI